MPNEKKKKKQPSNSPTQVADVRKKHKCTCAKQRKCRYSNSNYPTFADQSFLDRQHDSLVTQCNYWMFAQPNNRPVRRTLSQTFIRWADRSGGDLDHYNVSHNFLIKIDPFILLNLPALKIHPDDWKEKKKTFARGTRKTSGWQYSCWNLAPFCTLIRNIAEPAPVISGLTPVKHHRLSALRRRLITQEQTSPVRRRQWTNWQIKYLSTVLSQSHHGPKTALMY